MVAKYRGERYVAKVRKWSVQRVNQIRNRKALMSENSETSRAEGLLRRVTEGTAALTGSDFFHSLVQHLANVLMVRYAFIAECTDSTNSRVHTLAFWNGEDFAEDITFDLYGTPCANVIAGQACTYAERLQSLFPDDKELVNLGAEGYLGAPLRDGGGQVVGHLAVLDTKPMKVSPAEVSILKIFAARAGAELERVRAQRDVTLRSAELAALLDINQAIGHHLERDQLFGALALCLKSVVPAERFGIEIPIEGNRLQGHILSGMPSGEATVPTVLPAAGTVCDWVMQTRDWFVAGCRDEFRERFPVTYDVMAGEGMESLCAIALVSGGHNRGALFFMVAERDAYRHLRREFLEQVANQIAIAIQKCQFL
jgi:GAF domain-containing protein